MKLLSTALATLVFTVCPGAAAAPISAANFIGATIIDFEDRSGVNDYLPAGYGSANGISFSAQTLSYDYSMYGPALPPVANSAGLGVVGGSFGCNTSCGTGFSLSASATQVGFYFGSNVDVWPTSITALLNGQVVAVQTVSASAYSFGFVGFGEAGGIDQIIIGTSPNCGGGCVYQIDNIMFGQGDVNAVPEPGSLALLGLGLLGLGAARRKRAA